MRETLIKKYPDPMAILARGNIGEYPNDSFFHAESTILLRAAGANGGSLGGKTIEVLLDRIPCPSCEKVLPKIGLELGNPLVIYTEGDTGLKSAMQDGR